VHSVANSRVMLPIKQVVLTSTKVF